MENQETPWVEFSPALLKDGMELLVRTRDGDHHLLHYVSMLSGSALASNKYYYLINPPYSEITHMMVINPPKP